MLFFVNAPTKRRTVTIPTRGGTMKRSRARRTARRRYRRNSPRVGYRAAYAAGYENIFGGSRKRSGSRRRKSSATTKRRKKTMAKRKTKRRATGRRRSSVKRRRKAITFRRVSPKAYKRRSYRKTLYSRNPGGIMRMLKAGAYGAVGVLGGKAITRAVARLIPLPVEGMVGALAKGAIGALVAGFAMQKIAPRLAPFALASGMAEALTPVAQAIPVVGTYLGDDGYLGAYGDQYLGAYTDLGAYPALAGAGVDLGGDDSDIM